MNIKTLVCISITIFLGVALLLYINRKSSEDHAYAQIASIDENPVQDEELPEEAEDRDEEAEIQNEPAVLGSIFEICKPAPLLGVSEQIIKKKAYITGFSSTADPNGRDLRTEYRNNINCKRHRKFSRPDLSMQRLAHVFR